MNFLKELLDLARENTFVAIGLLLAIVLPCCFIVTMINKKKQSTGKDKEFIQGLVANVLPDSTTYTIMFVDYQKKTGTLKRNTTYYYYYAIAFRQWECVVMPINKDKSTGYKIDKMFKLTENNVATVDFSVIATEFLDEKDERIFSYFNKAKVSSFDKKSCPFNIDQTEEYEKYIEFMKPFSERINKKQ